MKNKLVLFTADFPYGSGETFLETEIGYLAKGFDAVTIISQNTSSNVCRSVPENCLVERIHLGVSASDKIKAVIGLFNPLFWKERKVIKTVYNKQFTKGIVTTMLISLYRARKVKALVSGLVQENEPAVKLSFYSYWCDDVAIGIAMAQKENATITCFSRMHGWDVYFEASAINYLPYRHFISENLKGIFAISQKGKDYTAERWKIPNPEKVKVTRLGVAEQKPVSPNIEEFILVSCSNVIPLKRVDLIIQALAELKDTRLKWVHFGDGTELERVKALALNLLPETIIAEFKGRVDNQTILQWYAENNPSVFINVSTTEGIPVSIMEAMSFGIPSIATNVGGTGEIVNEENGMLLAANPTIEEIGKEIENFIHLSKEERLLKSKAALNTFREMYDAEINYKGFAWI
jgi:glycosyltransferase involved in cell wall biosynthesis